MNDGGPAFPTQWVNDGDRNATAPDGQLCPPGCSVQMQGMTLRDYFAGKALIALMSSEPWVRGLDSAATKGNADFKGSLALNAYEVADAMLRERSK